MNRALGTITTEEASVTMGIMNPWGKYLEEQKNSDTVVGGGTGRYARGVLRSSVTLPSICVLEYHITGRSVPSSQCSEGGD